MGVSDTWNMEKLSFMVGQNWVTFGLQSVWDLLHLESRLGH